MHVINQSDIGVTISDFGAFDITLIRMLIKHRSKVMSRAIRPGTMSGGIRKLI